MEKGHPAVQHQRCVRKTVTSSGPLVQSRNALEHRRALSIPDAKLGDESEGYPSKRCPMRDTRENSRHYGASQPGSDRATRYRPDKDAEDPIGVSKQGASDGPALRLVEIAQPRSCDARHDKREVPSEIPRVLNSSVHSLSADRTVDMGCIASEEGSVAQQILLSA